MVEFIGIRTRLKADHVDDYIRAHDEIWPEVTANLRRVGIHRYLIFRDGLDLFHTVECDDWDAAVEALESDPVDQRWQAAMAEYTEAAGQTHGGGDRLPLVFRFDA